MPQIDLSLTGIFFQATGVVQAVLILLGLCSVLCWAVILDKAVTLWGLRRQLTAFEAAARSSLSALPASGLAQAALASGRDEQRHRDAKDSPADHRGNVERAMRDAVLAELVKAEARLPYLATIGSSAPFIGLFGTVWGIMHSFASIAQASDTSLAVVAPGIAEALSTTAIGLVAAIPASIAYNKLASDFGALARRFALSLGRIARHLDVEARAAE